MVLPVRVQFIATFQSSLAVKSCKIYLVALSLGDWIILDMEEFRVVKIVY